MIRAKVTGDWAGRFPLRLHERQDVQLPYMGCSRLSVLYFAGQSKGVTQTGTNP